MNFDLSIITYVLAGFVVILLLCVLRLEIKMRRLLKGGNGKSLESSITGALDDIKRIQEFQKNSALYFEDVEKRLGRSVQAVETIRFNPFKGTGEGGNQSFCTAFVSENGNGVVISSLYSRDRISVFSKPLEKFESTFELTDEEKEVVTGAKQKL
ncbi:MAG: DUF4446 family protein [bacterium]